MLEHLKKDNLAIMMWIDALSINHSNEREKGHQFGMMGEILRNAKEVVVWLGLSRPSDEVAFTVLESMGKET